MVTGSILPLNLENVSVRKRGNTILDDISLEITETDITIVMGPNGAGKTTLLRLMHGLERSQEGSIKWDCSDDIARTRQAFVFQAPVLMRRTVLQNIAYPLIVRGRGRKQAERDAVEWVENVGLGNVQKLEAGSLSGGERQKLAIARGLIIQPDVLFLDEPTTHLDGTSTREIEAILQLACEDGTRIIMTTHDIGQARRLASDVVFLNRGELCEHSPAEQFFDAPESTPAQAYLKGDIVE